MAEIVKAKERKELVKIEEKKPNSDKKSSKKNQ